MAVDTAPLTYGLVRERFDRMRPVLMGYISFGLWPGTVPGRYDLHMTGATCGSARNVTLERAYEIAEEWACSP